MSRILTALALVFLLSFMGFASLLSPVSITGNAQTSCNSNNTLNWFEAGGTPTGFNFVSSPPSLSDFDPARMMYEGFSGFAFTNGTISLQDAITDSVTHNSNYTQWTFHVKPGLKWSNGQDVTANDILTTYGPSFGLNSSFDVFNFESEVVRSFAQNASTAVFVLNKSDASFPAFAGANSFTGVYPQSFTQHGGAYSGINGTPGSLVGDGPFYVSNYKSGDTQMVMARNPYYTPLPGVCQIMMNFVESDAQDATYLIGGQADLAPLEAGAVASLAGHANLHIYDEQAVNDLFLGYNASVYPYNQLQFRQALEYGINQTEIQQKAFFGYYTTAYNASGGIPPQTTLWYSPHQVNYTYNPAQALSLLHSVGYTGGTNGAPLKYPNGTAVSLTIYSGNEFEGNTLAGGLIQGDLQKLGMTITIQSVSIGTLIADSYGGQLHYGMQLFDSGGPVHGIPYLDALPEWNVYTPTNPYPVWEPSPGAEASYQGNLTCVDSSADPAVITPCLDNIQIINSQQLPNIMLGFPDIIYGYNTAHLTNWPSFIIYGQQGTLSNAGIAQIQPAGATTSTATTNTTVTTPTTQTTTSTTTPTTTATTGSSTSAPSSGIAYPSLGVLAVIATIVILFAAFMSLRRRET